MKMTTKREEEEPSAASTPREEGIERIVQECFADKETGSPGNQVKKLLATGEVHTRKPRGLIKSPFRRCYAVPRSGGLTFRKLTKEVCHGYRRKGKLAPRLRQEHIPLHWLAIGQE